MRVHRARPGDEERLRAVRIASLADSPEAFGSTLAREQARTDEDWQRWFSPGVTYLCVDDSGSEVGLIAGVLDDDPEVAHLVVMWVSPASRGQGGGDALVAAVADWATEQRRRLRLRVVENNTHAFRLYERHGFRPTGSDTVRPDAVREVEMERTAP
jgi:ribosomal protein S18 acetylase RimI-like enzyme